MIITIYIDFILDDATSITKKNCNKTGFKTSTLKIFVQKNIEKSLEF